MNALYVVYLPLSAAIKVTSVSPSLIAGLKQPFIHLDSLTNV